MEFKELKDKNNREIINQSLDKLVRAKTQTWLDLGIDIDKDYISDMCSLMIDIFNLYADNRLDAFYCFALYNSKYSNRMLGTLWFYGLLDIDEKEMTIDITSSTFKYLMGK